MSYSTNASLKGYFNMKRLLATAAIMAAATGQVCAQQATAVGTGIANSRSDSKATAIGIGGTAVGGGVGNTGTVNNNNVPIANGGAVTIGGSPASQTITTQGKTSV